MYLGLRGFWGFYSSIGLTSTAWLRRSFLVGENFFNSRILRNPFLVGVFLIRVKRRAQDISSYTHAWRPSKTTLDLSNVYVSPSASPHQLAILSSKVSPLALGWNRRL